MPYVINIDAGLAFSTTEEKLAEAFSQYGNVLKGMCLYCHFNPLSD
jgi:hypothetical protein